MLASINELFSSLYSVEVAHQSLLQTVCADKCSGDCFTYTIKLGECIIPGEEWPGDEQWGTQPFMDTQVSAVAFNRTFYTDGSNECQEVDFVQKLPTHECIGPFGSPRPWGNFVYSD